MSVHAGDECVVVLDVECLNDRALRPLIARQPDGAAVVAGENTEFAADLELLPIARTHDDPLRRNVPDARRDG